MAGVSDVNPGDTVLFFGIVMTAFSNVPFMIVTKDEFKRNTLSNRCVASIVSKHTFEAIPVEFSERAVETFGSDLAESSSYFVAQCTMPSSERSGGLMLLMATQFSVFEQVT